MHPYPQTITKRNDNDDDNDDDEEDGDEEESKFKILYVMFRFFTTLAVLYIIPNVDFGSGKVITNYNCSYRLHV